MLAMFGTLSLGIRLAIIGGVLAAGIGTFAVWRNSIYESGQRDMQAAIARGDQKAVDGAFQMRQGLERCEATGRGWDQTTGECR